MKVNIIALTLFAACLVTMVMPVLSLSSLHKQMSISGGGFECQAVCVRVDNPNGMELDRLKCAFTPEPICVIDAEPSTTLLPLPIEDVALEPVLDGCIVLPEPVPTSINFCDIIEFTPADINGVAKVEWLDPNNTIIDTEVKWFFNVYLKAICDEYIDSNISNRIDIICDCGSHIHAQPLIFDDKNECKFTCCKCKTTYSLRKENQ
ncbi:MAG: hypothetical protein PHQ00_00055 [Phycisphaerae bacterium]|nr:hypothetical protein [Phycisphaerae bacterium]